jgi:isoleucyl-tRNA synthetase
MSGIRWMPPNCSATRRRTTTSITDILDVWFDSGVTHEGVLLERGLGKPADLYLEGSDQHRGWFQSSLLTGVAIDKAAPYKQCLTHGFTVDEHGRKMSKSLGNGIEPQDIMKTLGADILRLWIASADYSNEMSLSQEILKRNADAYRRIRNTARFLLGNLHGFDPARDLVATGGHGRAGSLDRASRVAGAGRSSPRRTRATTSPRWCSR